MKYDYLIVGAGLYGQGNLCGTKGGCGGIKKEGMG